MLISTIHDKLALSNLRHVLHIQTQDHNFSAIEIWSQNPSDSKK